MTGSGNVIEAEIAWFGRILERRFKIHGGEMPDGDILTLEPPPPLSDEEAPYARAVTGSGLDSAERLVLILAALPYLRPQALDPLLIQNQAAGRRFTEFGGVTGGPHSGFAPTRETALFLLAGEDMEQRLRYLGLFEPDSALQRLRILEEPADPAGPGPWTPLILSRAWLGRITTGARAEPRFGPQFPAQILLTDYEWDDLVLPEEVKEEVGHLVDWVENEALLRGAWGLGKHLKPGYRALFHGPPGTGKTMTAALLGKQLGLPVYRVDLSRVVSKWIGETEKNLAALFDCAEYGDMILFFDEADALFGKRGDTRSANDRHSNQQIAYLLQRIEDSPGVVILASNLRGNIDEAFARRFQAMVYFPMPDAEARLYLLKKAFETVPDDRLAGTDLAAFARDHELSGGAIVNVLRHVCIRAAARGGAIDEAALRAAARREFAKQGRSPS